MFLWVCGLTIKQKMCAKQNVNLQPELWEKLRKWLEGPVTPVQSTQQLISHQWGVHSDSAHMHRGVFVSCRTNRWGDYMWCWITCRIVFLSKNPAGFKLEMFWLHTWDIQGRRSVCSKRILRGFQTHKEEKCVYRLSRLPSSHKHPPSSLTACRWWNSGSFSTPPHAENRFRQTVSSQLAIFPAPIGRHLAPEIKKHQQESLDVCCEALLRQQAVWEEVSRGRLPRRRLSQVTDGEVWSQWARSARRVILRRRWYRTWFIRPLFYNVTHIFKQPSNLASYWLFYSARQWYIANI